MERNFKNEELKWAAENINKNNKNKELRYEKENSGDLAKNKGSRQLRVFNFSSPSSSLPLPPPFPPSPIFLLETLTSMSHVTNWRSEVTLSF